MSDPIRMFKVHMPHSVDAPLLEVLHSGYIGQGPKVEEFEEKLRTYLHSPHVLTVNSGTSALQLALRLANVGPGDEVITTPMSCSATNEPILALGATPRWADIDPLTGLIDPESVIRNLSQKTKAIMAVHWGGTPAPVAELRRIADQYHIKLIEDAAHCFWWNEKSTHQKGHFTCYSFQAIKHITTVDGGALVCEDEDDYKRGKLLRWYGIDREQPKQDMRCEEDILEWGYKFHMNDVAAVIGIEQMKYIDEIVDIQRSNAVFYDEAFSDSQLAHYFQPCAKYRVDSAYWLYTLLLPDRETRKRFQIFMKANQVDVSQVHSRNDQHTAFMNYILKSHGWMVGLSGVSKFVDRQVSIPVHWALTNEQLFRIADLCNDFTIKEELA